MAQLTHAHVAVGDAAPDFSGTDEAGHMHRLAEYRGKTLLVCFLPRPEHIPSGRDLSGRFPGSRQKDVFILGVMPGSPQSVGKARAARRIPFPMVCDSGRIAADYGVDGKTSRFTIFAIGPDGRVKAVYKNLDNPRHLNELLNRL
ncbi:MAG: redoxin domain-containing protein [Elusimicrobia bacterium]|nr:redoxin domain-containing protein [Elusimicrobiota bacterium]